MAQTVNMVANIVVWLHNASDMFAISQVTIDCKTEDMNGLQTRYDGVCKSYSQNCWSETLKLC